MLNEKNQQQQKKKTATINTGSRLFYRMSQTFNTTLPSTSILTEPMVTVTNKYQLLRFQLNNNTYSYNKYTPIFPYTNCSGCVLGNKQYG